MAQSINGAGVTSLVNTTAADGDVLPIVDVSDTTEAATGTTKKITALEFSEAIGGYPVGTKVYRALLTQTGVSAPVATELQDTIGIVQGDWGYQTVGHYSLAPSVLTPFTEHKTIIRFGDNSSAPIDQTFKLTFRAQWVVNNDLNFYVYDNGTLANARIIDTAVEIIVFP